MSKNCCVNCFSIAEICQYIENEEIVGDCDYCGSKNVKIRPVLDVSEFILEGFHRLYEDAAEHVGYCNSEGGYLLPTNDIHEILNEIEDIFGESLDDPTDLLNDLAPFDGTPYVRNDPYGPPSGQPDEIDYWENYRRVVKTEKRFTIFLNETEPQYELKEPGNFLRRLASVHFPELIRILPIGKIIYRARIKKEGRKYEHEDLTSPKSHLTKNNRMSPAGISFFYGADDSDTCIHEIRPSLSEIVVVGEFETLKKLLVLDLSTKIESSLSIFNEDYVFGYEEYIKPFLRHFVADIAKPLRSSDQEIEYIPTQVLTEFIRSTNFKDTFYLPDENNEPADVFLHGILFQSSSNEKGVNVVLFKGPDISTESPEKNSSAWLFFKGYKENEVKKIRVESIPLGFKKNVY